MVSHSKMESIGVFLPAKIMSKEEIESGMTHQGLIDINGITGINEIRVCSAEENSLSNAIAAAKNCLAASSYQAEDLDIIISTSISRHFVGDTHKWEPAMSLDIKKAIGASRAIHFDLSNACAGMMSGVFILDSMIRSGTVKKGMVVSGEYITGILKTAQKEVNAPFHEQFGSLTVGDSGAAVIIDESTDPADRINFLEMSTCAAYAHLCIGKPSETGQGPALYTDNTNMHSKERVAMLPALLKKTLEGRNSTVAQEKFDFVIYHQIGAKAMINFSRFTEAILRVEMPKHLNIVEWAGNTSTTSHFVVLHHHLTNGTIAKGSKLLVVPGASGIVMGVMSLSLSNVRI